MNHSPEHIALDSAELLDNGKDEEENAVDSSSSLKDESKRPCISLTLEVTQMPVDCNQAGQRI